MKKIIIERKTLETLRKKNTFLNRSDMVVFAADSNADILKIHREERADLIITRLDLNSMSPEDLVLQIRSDAPAKAVAIIMICAKTTAEIERSMHAGANAVLPRPYKTDQLLTKARKLLRLSLRETHRVLLSVAIEGNTSDTNRFCRTIDISSTGLLMETDLQFKPGNRVVCSFYLPDANTTHIDTMGEVVRIIPPTSAFPANRYGVQFLDLAPIDAEAIEAYLDLESARTHPEES